nr:MAG TPA: hypothetical protein [Caudoviricetes sp.]
MKDKTQYEALMEELKKLANNFKDVVTELGDILAKILPDVEIPDEEEDTWEMKCPYEYGDNHYCIKSDGEVFPDSWRDIESDNRYFSQGNIFQTEQAAKLEAKRRNLLTRFRAFRDECNDGWKPDWNNHKSKKWCITKNEEGMYAMWTFEFNSFSYFGSFKNQADCERAIELFGDEIKALFVDC